MIQQSSLPNLALLAGVAAFAACGLTLALLGLGLPYALGAAASGLCAGLLIYALGRWTHSHTPPAPAENPAGTRVTELERELSSLRHELRGALSPALMVSDRLLKSDDPLIRRAGDTVVRSIDRATTLLGQDQPRPPLTPPAA